MWNGRQTDIETDRQTERQANEANHSIVSCGWDSLCFVLLFHQIYFFVCFVCAIFPFFFLTSLCAKITSQGTKPNERRSKKIITVDIKCTSTFLATGFVLSFLCVVCLFVSHLNDKCASIFLWPRILPSLSLSLLLFSIEPVFRKLNFNLIVT